MPRRPEQLAHLCAVSTQAFRLSTPHSGSFAQIRRANPTAPSGSRRPDRVVRTSRPATHPLGGSPVAASSVQAPWIALPEALWRRGALRPNASGALFPGAARSAPGAFCRQPLASEARSRVSGRRSSGHAGFSRGCLLRQPRARPRARASGCARAPSPATPAAHCLAMRWHERVYPQRCASVSAA